MVKDTAHEVFKFTATFYLTILQRSEIKALIPRFINALKSYINYDPRNGAWLIEQFSNWEVVEEMLLQVYGQEMPKLTVGLLYCAMVTIYESEKEMLASYWPSEAEREKAIAEQGEGAQLPYGKLGPLGNFALLLLSHIYDLKMFTRNLPHYF